MIYVDTGVLVALCVNEPMSAAVAQWYSASKSELSSAVWCVTEFASALGIKQRTMQITAAQSAIAWQSFERLCAADLQLLSIEPDMFQRAAILALDPATRLRAGDALHLAVALQVKAKSIATLDGVLAQNAKVLKIKSVAF